MATRATHASHPGRPSAIEATSAVFCLNVRHLRRRGTPVYRVTGFVPLHGFGVDSVDGKRGWLETISSIRPQRNATSQLTRRPESIMSAAR